MKNNKDKLEKIVLVKQTDDSRHNSHLSDLERKLKLGIVFLQTCRFHHYFCVYLTQ